jgi:hypothetical protein
LGRTLSTHFAIETMASLFRSASLTRHVLFLRIIPNEIRVAWS